ncbi:MAG: ribosomal protein S18-alanine N-acetyltransferase [Clostridia bacterium]|nr:ribosomal protein S18-alanine N-acetyltransferase [Clostridia bacterium]
MAEIKISPMLKSDACQLAEIDRVVFGGTFKAEDFLNYLESPIYYFNVAKIDDRAVGYIGYIIIAGECDIINIGVLPEHRGIGIGNMLMDAMIDELVKSKATCVHLEVRKSNFRAISLYEKYGFKATGVSKNHYKEPTEDAIRMKLCLLT